MNSKSLYVLFNHELTEEQVLDAKNSLGIVDITILPNRLRELWSNVPPESNLVLSDFLSPFIDFFNSASRGSYVLIQGDFGAVFILVKHLQSIGLIPVYSTTRRKVLSERNVNNQIVINKVFKHICYRKY